MNKKLTFSAALAALAFAGAAQAQYLPAGWSIGVGVTQVKPNVSSGTLAAPSAPNTQIGVGSDTQPTLWVRDMVTEHFGIEVPIGAGFRQDITGAGAISGVGKIGSVRALPITLLGEYHFMDRTSRFRPYGALGISYAKLYKVASSATLSALNPINPPGGTGLSIESRWGAVVGAGLTYDVNDRLYLDAQYLHVFLKTTARLSTGQTISAKLNPDVMRLGIGYRF
jgi:outer membrane protein